MSHRQMLQGRHFTRFVPLPVERMWTPHYGSFGYPSPVREVPYVPTPQRVIDEMFRAFAISEKDVVYDLGCGDGRIVITAARDYGARAVGIDIDPERLEACRRNAIESRVQDRVRFDRQSFFEVDLTGASVVTLYLLPWVNIALRPRLLEQLKPGSRMISHAFSMGSWNPDRTIRVDREKRILYLWIVPANVGGTWRATLRDAHGQIRHALLHFEQEFQNVLGSAQLDGIEIPLLHPTLLGDRLQFTLEVPGEPEQSYACRVDGDSLRCTTPGNDLRARRNLPLRAYGNPKLQMA